MIRTEDVEFLELSPHQTRQYIDAVKVFEAHEEATKLAAEVRGGMYWHKGPAHDPEAKYLVRTAAAGGETSLGARSPDTEKIYADFVARKEAHTRRLRDLKERLTTQERLNRALRVGRVAPLVVGILARLVETRLSEHFRVVGTHALYAYESEAGIRFDEAALATNDIDLMWDIQKRVRFATTLSRLDSSMLGVLQKVDPTFRVKDDQRYTAVNGDGFEVDILRRSVVGDDPHPVRLSEAVDDFYAVQAIKSQRLLDAPAFSAVVVATNGKMARMNTLHPMAFVRFKEWMGALPTREAMKRSRDRLQARLVKAAVDQRLPHLQDGTA